MACNVCIISWLSEKHVKLAFFLTGNKIIKKITFQWKHHKATNHTKWRVQDLLLYKWDIKPTEWLYTKRLWRAISATRKGKPCVSQHLSLTGSPWVRVTEEVSTLRLQAGSYKRQSTQCHRVTPQVCTCVYVWVFLGTSMSVQNVYLYVCVCVCSRTILSVCACVRVHCTQHGGISGLI